jgi:hypothetical protein
MFVRDNTTCPNCGECQTFDFSVSEVESDVAESFLVIAECIHCSRQWRRHFFFAGCLEYLHNILDVVDADELSPYLLGLYSAFRSLKSDWNAEFRAKFLRCLRGFLSANRVHMAIFRNPILLASLKLMREEEGSDMILSDHRFNRLVRL